MPEEFSLLGTGNDAVILKLFCLVVRSKEFRLMSETIFIVGRRN